MCKEYALLQGYTLSIRLISILPQRYITTGVIVIIYKYRTYLQMLQIHRMHNNWLPMTGPPWEDYSSTDRDTVPVMAVPNWKEPWIRKHKIKRLRNVNASLIFKTCSTILGIFFTQQFIFRCYIIAITNIDSLFQYSQFGVQVFCHRERFRTTEPID